MARNFLGTAEPTTIFLLEPKGPDEAYIEVMRDMCAFYGEDDDDCERARGDVEAAQNGGGQWFVSGIESCKCGGNTYDAAPVFLMPSQRDEAMMVTERAIHEYTHAVQNLVGGPLATWMAEGGAVYNECFFTQTIGNFPSFSDCMMYGGGGGGVIRKARELYQGNDIQWFTLYASDRCCGSHCPPAGGISQEVDRQVYYDLGAIAVAFAIKRAKDKFGRSSADYWRAPSPKGFWRSTSIPYEIDRKKGWPSDVPEGAGWKKALTEFTGDATYVEFQAAFELMMRPSSNGGGVATVEQIKEAAFGETDAEVYTMSNRALDKSSSETFGPNDKCCVENKRSKFYLKPKRDGNGVIIGIKKKNCKWLQKRKEKQQTKICKRNMSNDKYGAAKSVCRVTCDTC